MFDATAYSEAQREYIADTIEIAYQQVTDFLKRLESTASKEPTNFRGRRVPLEVSANASLAFGNPDGGDLAKPGSPKFNHLQIPYVHVNIGLETSYNAILNEGRETVGNAFEQIAESTAKTLMKRLNIYASNGDGTTKLGIVSARTSNAVLTLDGATDTIGATQLIEEQRVLIWDPTGTTQRVGTVGSGTIRIASLTQTTITRGTGASGDIDWPSDVVAGDIVCPEGATPSVGMKGIPYINNNVGDYFGLARSVVRAVQSTIVPAAGGALSAAFLQAARSRTKQRSGQFGTRENGITELAMGITQHDAYATLLTPISFQHITDGRPKGDLGFASQEFTWFGTPLNEYADWLGTRVDFLNMKHLKIANCKEVGALKGMPINDELQSFNGTTGVYRMAKSRYWDCARDNFSPSPYRLGAVTGLSVSGLSQQKS